MSNTVLKRRISEKLSAIPENSNSIIVLKGIPLSTVCDEIVRIDIDEIIKNKLAYFMQIYNKRRFLAYEEFLLLSSFIVDQYETIYVLNNNLYINQYPIDSLFSEETKKGILNHFTESDDDYDESEIASDEILDLYNGVKEYNGYLIGAYSEEKVPNTYKIIQKDLFDYYPSQIQSVAKPDYADILEIEEESDYIELIKRVFEEPDEIYIRTINYTGDVNSLNDHISILRYYWSDYTDVFSILPEEIGEEYEHRDDYTEILKKYWGYDQFREFQVYDLKSLEKGKKETVTVSQEKIISDLVQQVENCAAEEKDYHDVFVTAPTGAGKSVIFQVPAIYLAEKYNLLTIVISPLIGLMNDQVNNLEKKNYKGAKTINSNVSPIVKEDILQNVAEGTYDILYISPETLLARSDVEQLIGDRTIGMIVIDEAHIVTTWGKQFRPDYWYLGDHISKLRKRQLAKKGRSFVIGTFTATAIYHGVEDMYEETKNSLHMIDPITYLGYVKRNDIDINIDNTKKPSSERSEYETDKFNQIEDVIKRAVITNKKTLIYFPTVSLIEACYRYLEHKPIISNVTKYYGPLNKDEKEENYQLFLNGEKLVMLATKAFGMGIDINNIELVVHYAPTGNVCDYVQEIGRAARRKDLRGEAYYHYNSRDFKFINRLHGLSTIKKYQLIEVIKKIDELFSMNRSAKSGSKLKNRNAMLLDAENFTYIFDNPVTDGDESINKVKTALLIIQKDFESKLGFSPITVRPIPMFSIGFFRVEPMIQNSLKRVYGDCLSEINELNHICKVNLSVIWAKDNKDKSFAEFKYKLYSHDQDFLFNQKYPMYQAYCVDIDFENNYHSKFTTYWNAIKKTIHDAVIAQEYISPEKIENVLHTKCGFRKYKSQAICEILIASMDLFRRNYSKGVNSIFTRREMQNNDTKYLFNTAIGTYFKWVEDGFEKIIRSTINGEMYLVNRGNSNEGKELNTILGVLEAMDILSFEMNGGANSQLYIYINQIRPLKTILDNPGNYDNRLLNMVAERHLISVKMLTYIYEDHPESSEAWDILEDYFLGKIPERVKANCRKDNPNIKFE